MERTAKWQVVPAAIRRMLGAALACSAAAGSAAALEGEFDCLLEPYTVVNASTALEGVLATLVVEKGDFVEEGAVVATLESEVEQAAVEHAKARVETEATLNARRARLEYNRKKHTRALKLRKNKFISPDEIDEFQSAVTVAEQELKAEEENKGLAMLELKRVNAQLRMRTIRSPITGVVVQRYLSPGEFAQAQPILRLAQLDPLNVEVVLPVSAYGQVSEGMEAEIHPGPPVGGLHRARVTIVDRVIDAASGTFGVRLELPNPQARLPAGLECRVKFLGSL